MHKTFALKLILLINQGYLDVIHRHCYADTYTDNSFDEDNYQQDGPTVSESDESTPTAVIQPAVSCTRPCLHACVCICSSVINPLCLCGFPLLQPRPCKHVK